MKTTRKIENTKLGGLVIAGVLFLVFTLYMIGKNQNMFGASITVKAIMDNVNGLVAGNSVRYKGLNAGTVKSITMANDSVILVDLYIQKKMVPFIKSSVLATISTDGLMGNKLIQLIAQPGPAMTIQNGDTIYALGAVTTDDMLQRMGASTDYVQKTAQNLFEITTKLNSSKHLWDLVGDSLIMLDIKTAIADLRLASSRTAALADTGDQLMKELKNGEGLIHKLFTDTAISDEFASSLNNIRQASEQAIRVVQGVEAMVDTLASGEGTVEMLLNDETFRNTLSNSMSNIEMSTAKFNENMEAMRSNFLFRKYFKKLEKEKQ